MPTSADPKLSSGVVLCISLRRHMTLDGGEASLGKKRYPEKTQGTLGTTCRSDPSQTLAVTFPPEDDLTSCLAPGSRAAVSAATAASAAGVFAAIAVSVAGALFHLLPLRVTCLLFIQLHVLLVLLLLEFVSFLLLLRNLLFLLLLVLPVQLRVARVWSALR